MRTRRLLGIGAALLVGTTISCSEDAPGIFDPDVLLRDTPFELPSLGLGEVRDRFTGELWVHGNTAYTTTWGNRSVNGISSRGDAIKIWDVTAPLPVLVDSVIVSGATTIGDVQVTADGRYLVAATEAAPGSIVIYDLTNPRKPVLVNRFQNSDTNPGVHTAEVQVVAGRLYAFLSIDPGTGIPARLVIVDITNPASPSMVFTRAMGTPFVHDVFVRDGIMMTALWNDGLAIWDIGGGDRGGTVANPVRLTSLNTKDGKAHNVYWVKDPENDDLSYAIVGEEGPGSVPSSSSGDVHVIDISDLANPKEVAFFNVPGAGVHNFTVDEERGILYAAYYNAGVRAFSIRGELGSCSSSQKSSDGRCDLAKMKREVAKGPVGLSGPVFIWGVQFTDNRLFASDMINGLWRLSTVPES